MKEKLKNWWFMSPEEAASSADAVYTRVMPSQRRSTFSLWAFAIAFAYTITAFIVGGSLLDAASSTVFWRDILVGYAALVFISFLVAVPAYKTGCNTTIFMRYVFGENGYIVPAIIMVVLIIFHSGFQCSTFGEVLFPMGSPQFVAVCLICGLLVIVSLIKGIKGLETAANIAIGFLIISVAVCFVLSLREIGGLEGFNTYINNRKVENAPTEMYLINTVIGSWTIGCCTNGNYTRYCKNKVSMFGFCILAFFVFQLLLALLGAFSVITVDTYIFVNFARKINVIFGAFCTIAFLLALWTTINGNIYLIQIPVASAAKGSIKSIGLICGALAGFMGAAGFSRFATPVLNISGTLLPPFIGPLIVDYYLNKDRYYYNPVVMGKKMPKWNWCAFASSIAGLVIGYVWIPLFVPVSIWSILLSAIIYMVLFWVLKAAGIRVGLSAVEIDDELKQAAFEPYTPEQLENK